MYELKRRNTVSLLPPLSAFCKLRSSYVPFLPFCFLPGDMNLTSTPHLPENGRQYHTRRPSRRQFSCNDLRPHENYVHNWMYAGSDSEAVDTSLDVSSIVLTTLRDAAKFSPVPFLSAAAGIAVEIFGAVQVSERQ